jgi:predicted nucleic acid-binding protein
MILYLDSSALAKRYLSEEGSVEVEKLLVGAERVGTSIVSRVEVVAALGRARRQKLLDDQPAARLRTLFAGHWPSLVRLSLSETTVQRADGLAWELGLRGYDAVHLASALAWREAIMDSPVFATFDKALAKAARTQGFDVWPKILG